MNILEWLVTTPIATWVTTSAYGYYICLSGHAIGMAVVAGTMLMAALRVLGFSRHTPLSMFDRLFKIAWAGFALNLVTGVMLFAANAKNLSANLAFLLKLGFIAVGGLAVYFLWRAVKSDEKLQDGEQSATLSTKLLAIMTLGCWVAAIVAGRIIGYTISY
jgi:hypothetical protein